MKGKRPIITFNWVARAPVNNKFCVVSLILFGYGVLVTLDKPGEKKTDPGHWDGNPNFIDKESKFFSRN